MNSAQFDTFLRSLIHTQSRRGVLASAIGLLASACTEPTTSGAKNKKKHKKATLCLEGQTIKASKRKKKKLLKQGATSGACAGCTPSCTSKSCGSDDGCGGTCGCAANALCQAGVCQPCSVVCSGDAIACGNQLQIALTGAGGGTVYVCPGRYVGNFTVGNGALVGAGDGTDPATNTILDANGSGRVVLIDVGANAALQKLRITGGNVPADFGGGIRNQGTLNVTACTITQNRADLAAGFYNDIRSTAVLNNCTISENTANGSGGGLFNDAVGGIGSVLTIKGTTITGNQTMTGSGGGIFNFGTVTLDSASSVTGNTCSATPPNSGGGIFDQLSGGEVTLNGATVSGNSPDNCFHVTGC